MKFVYQPKMKECIIDGADTTKYLIEPEYYDLGLYSNRKKALQAVINHIDEVLGYFIMDEIYPKVKIYDKNNTDLSVRIEVTAGSVHLIEWHEAVVKKIEVN